MSFKVSVLAALESSDDIESEVSARDLAEYINRLIDLMPARQRQVFQHEPPRAQSYRGDRRRTEPFAKTVEAHMHEALRFLRDNLALLLWRAFQRRTGLLNDIPTGTGAFFPKITKITARTKGIWCRAGYYTDTAKTQK